jgi:Polyketide cyclase / dehydrase and lipid transport
MRIEHVFTVAAPPDAIFVHLADPANYVGLSPLVVAVRDVRLGDGMTRYRAVERFRLFGRLSYDNVIAVTLVADAGRLTVSGDVRSPGWVRMAYRFEITPDGGGAAVTDSLLLRAPPGLRRFAAGRAREVQLARARILAERLAPA